MVPNCTCYIYTVQCGFSKFSLARHPMGRRLLIGTNPSCLPSAKPVLLPLDLDHTLSADFTVEVLGFTRGICGSFLPPLPFPAHKLSLSLLEWYFAQINRRVEVNVLSISPCLVVVFASLAPSWHIVLWLVRYCLPPCVAFKAGT